MSVQMNEMPGEFHFPKNLSKLTAAEREELHFRWLAHNATSESCDTSPSKVIDVNSPEYKATLAERQAKIDAEKAELQESLNDENDVVKDSSPYEFVPGVGYVLPAGEDLQAIAGRLSPEAYAEFLKRQPNQKKKPHPFSAPPPEAEIDVPDGDTEDRFDDLWI